MFPSSSRDDKKGNRGSHRKQRKLKDKGDIHSKQDYQKALFLKMIKLREIPICIACIYNLIY